MSIVHDSCTHAGCTAHNTPYGSLCCHCYEEWVRDHHRIPQATLDGLKRYVKDGIQPGGFLTLVLCNDKMSTIAGRADEINALNIVKIYRYLVNKCPHECWGSEAKVRAWLEKFS